MRTGIGDFFFATVTHLGEETFFLALAILFYWCISKRQGYYILFTGLVGTVINQFLKILCRIPRPWIIDQNFKPVGAAIEEATGYSFPSGHTQNVAGTYGCIGRYNRQRWLKITCLVIILLVAFSRMYLGVHTPLDVLVSLGIALVVIFGLYYVVYQGFDKPKRIYIACAALLLAAIANLLFVTLYPFPADVDAVNLANGQKTAWQMLALAIGLCIIYPLDRHYIKFETKAVWWAQIIKLVIGVGLVLAVRMGLKAPLNALFGVNVGAGVRYFLIVVVAGILWPLTFQFWSKLGQKKEETK